MSNREMALALAGAAGVTLAYDLLPNTPEDRGPTVMNQDIRRAESETRRKLKDAVLMVGVLSILYLWQRKG